MIGLSQLLEAECYGNNATLKYIHMMNNCIQGLAFTAHNIMELSKLRLRNFRPKLSSVNVPNKIDSIIGLFEDQIESK